MVAHRAQQRGKVALTFPSRPEGIELLTPNLFFFWFVAIATKFLGVPAARGREVYFVLF